MTKNAKDHSFPTTLVTPLWGDWHPRRFERSLLPSLLDASNLPAFANMHQTNWIFFTSAEARDFLQGLARWDELRAHITPHFEILSASQIGRPIDVQQSIWSRSLEIVAAEKRHIFFMPPDVVWSRGSLKRIGEEMCKGCDITIMPWAMRIESDGFVPAYERDGAEEHCISGRELVRYLLKFPHPLMASHQTDSDHFTRHPEIIIEPAKDHGLAMKMLAGSPTVFPPHEIKLNHQKLIDHPGLNMDRVYMPRSTDDVFAISLAPGNKDLGMYDRERFFDTTAVAQFLFDYPCSMEKEMVDWTYLLIADDNNKPEWKRAEAALDEIADDVTAAKRMLGAWEEIRRHGDYRYTSELIAMMVQENIFPDSFKTHDKGLMFLAPNNEFWELVGLKLMDNAIHPDNNDKLKQFMSELLFPLQRPMPNLTQNDWTMRPESGDKTVTIAREGGRITLNGEALTHGILDTREGDLMAFPHSTNEVLSAARHTLSMQNDD